MSIASILFDLDGTLVDTSPGIERALKEAISTIMPGRETTIPNVRSIIGPPIRDMLKKALPSADNTILNELDRQFRQGYDSIGWQECTAYNGVAETMACLVQLNLKCFVVTNKRNMPAIRILDRLKLRAHFSEIVSWDSGVPAFASKSDMVCHIIQKYRLNPEEALLVGDSRDDAQAAQICGAKFAAVAYGYGDVHALQECRKDYMLEKFADLLPIVHESLREAVGTTILCNQEI